MRTLPTSLILAALLWAGCSSAPDGELLALTKKWQKAQNAKDLGALIGMYGSICYYMGENLDEAKILQGKARQFDKYARYEEEARSALVVSPEKNGAYSVCFRRRIIVDDRVLEAPFCLVFHPTNGQYRIIEELDSITCSNLRLANKNPQSVAVQRLSSGASAQKPVNQAPSQPAAASAPLADDSPSESETDTETQTQPKNNNPNDRDYPEASETKLTPPDLFAFDTHELRLMRNEIFAVHGYIFQSKDLKEHFGKKTWYNPRYTNVDDKLTPLERDNVRMIKYVEDGLKNNKFSR